MHSDALPPGSSRRGPAAGFEHPWRRATPEVARRALWAPLRLVARLCENCWFCCQDYDTWVDVLEAEEAERVAAVAREERLLGARDASARALERLERRAASRLEAPGMLPYYYPSLPISYPRVSTMRSGSADDPPSEK